MRNISLQLSTYGKGVAPKDWTLVKTVEMQRIYYILGGNGQFQMPDGSYQLFKKDHFYIFPYNLSAKFLSEADVPVDHIYFDFVSVPPILASKPLCVPADNSQLQSLAALFKETISGHNCKDFDYGYSLLHITLTLLQRYVQIPFREDPVIAQALTLMWSGYMRPLSVSEIAAYVHLEANYFIRKFKRAMGQTPYAYLRAYRLARAREYILAGNTAEQAAQKTGFSDASSLSRALRTIDDGVCDGI